MYQITVSEEIKNACPIFKGAAVYAEVTNTAFAKGFGKRSILLPELTSTTQPEDIKLQPAIAATREAYKRCGKDLPLPSFCRSLAPPSDARNCPLPNRYIG